MIIPVKIVADGIDWPAWVQAGGSVIAIIVAANLVKLERLHGHVEAMEAFRGVCLVIRDEIHAAAKAAEDHAMTGTVLQTYSMATLSDLPEWLGDTPVFELYSTKAPQMLLRWKRMAQELHNHLMTGMSGPLPAANLYAVRDLHKQIDEDWVTVDQWVRERRRRRAFWWLPW